MELGIIPNYHFYERMDVHQYHEEHEMKIKIASPLIPDGVEYEANEFYINLDPTTGTMGRIGPGARNGFVGLGTIIQFEHSGLPDKITGIRLIEDLSQTNKA